MEAAQVHLDPEMQQLIADALADGEYQSPDEVVLLALRQWRTNILVNAIGADEFQKLLQSASKDARPGRPADEVFERLLRNCRTSEEKRHAADAA